MEYKILQDCSPYYIRYTHTGINNIIDISKRGKEFFINDLTNKKAFIHYRLPLDFAHDILSNTYKASELNFNEKRVSLFVTQPGHYYRPHKDGLAVPVGINYNIEIFDDKCVTSWYSDVTFAGRPIDTLGGVSREIGDFNAEIEKTKHNTLKTMIAQSGEAVLFNTDLYHSVDNTNSNNERTILTLRSNFFEKMNFFQARKILFNY